MLSAQFDIANSRASKRSDSGAQQDANMARLRRKKKIVTRRSRKVPRYGGSDSGDEPGDDLEGQAPEGDPLLATDNGGLSISRCHGCRKCLIMAFGWQFKASEIRRCSVTLALFSPQC
jgi:hypothetical protein